MKVELRIELTERQIELVPALVDGVKRGALAAMERGDPADLEICAQELSVLIEVGRAVRLPAKQGAGGVLFSRPPHKHIYSDSGVCTVFAEGFGICQAMRVRKPRAAKPPEGAGNAQEP
jgi:hypothetical protein